MDEKQLLFETEYNIDEAQYLRYNQEVTLKKRNKWNTIADSICVVLLLGLGIVHFCLTHSITYFLAALFFAVFVVAFNLFLRWLGCYKTRKIWKSRPVTTERYHVRFFDTFLDCESSLGTTRLEYSQIYKLIETPTDFYIMISMVQGIPVRKDALTEENAAFIRALAPKKEKKRKRG